MLRPGAQSGIISSSSRNDSAAPFVGSSTYPFAFNPSGLLPFFARQTPCACVIPTVVLLGCRNEAGQIYILDEHVERYWIPSRHAQAIKSMLARNEVFCSKDHLRDHLLARFPQGCTERENLWRELQRRRILTKFVAGSDAFGKHRGLVLAHGVHYLGLDEPRLVNLAKAFAKGTGYGVAMAIIPVIMLPVLALGSAEYQA